MAQAEEPLGLPLGASAPFFAVPSTEGGEMTLPEALKAGHLILQFSRPAW